MGNIQEFFKNPLSVMMAFFLMLFVVKEVFELWKWYKGRADDYHKSESAKEDFIAKVNVLEDEFIKSAETMADIKKTLLALHERLDNYEEDRKQDFVVSSRATLYQLYETLKDKDELTLSEYETFCNLGEKYLSSGGNGAFRNKIIPEIQCKPIKDD